MGTLTAEGHELTARRDGCDALQTYYYVLYYMRFLYCVKWLPVYDILS